VCKNRKAINCLNRKTILTGPDPKLDPGQYGIRITNNRAAGIYISCLLLGLYAENHGCFDRSRLLPRHRHSESGPAVGLAYEQVESALPQVFLFSFTCFTILFW